MTATSGGWIAAAFVVASALPFAAVRAQTDPGSPPLGRPEIMFNRWQEDWSVLADPRTPREPFDELKYIPLVPWNPDVYLSFGANLRERFEGNDAPGFGIGHTNPEDYDISRLEAHADLRLGPTVQVFTQLVSAFAPGKTRLVPPDQDRLDVEQAFVALVEPFDGGTLKFRVGRQEIGFDLQRFVGVRDGPNLRQAYDAVWGDYVRGPWRVIAFYSLPVQTRDLRAFDAYSSVKLTYGGARLERQLGPNRLSLSYSRFTQAGARYLQVTGDERRDIFDVHDSGADRGFDWDAEVMGQTGQVGADPVHAWALGSVSGYTLESLPWTPRLGLQVDAASGTGEPGSRHVGTFNPLFPNGYYVTLAGYTGYVNFIHVKPSVTVRPAAALKVMLAMAGQWRESTADAVYTQPNVPVPNTAGRGGDWTGSYVQLRTEYVFNPHMTGAIEAVRFTVGDAVRQAGGHDSDYLGVELKFGW